MGLKAIVKTIFTIKGKEQKKLDSIFQVDQTSCLVEREAERLVRRWRDRSTEDNEG